MIFILISKFKSASARKHDQPFIWFTYVLLQSIRAYQVSLAGLWWLRQRQHGDASHGGVPRGSVLPHAVSTGRGGL